jgi:hypothetical protein
MHLIPIISFQLGQVSIPTRRSFSPLFLFCAYDSSVLQNFKIFTHLLLYFSYSTLLLTEVEFESCAECNYFNDKARKVRKTFPDFILQPLGKVFRSEFESHYYLSLITFAYLYLLAYEWKVRWIQIFNEYSRNINLQRSK